MPLARRLLLLVAAAAGLLATAGPARAADPTVWLCRPGLKANPCTSSLTTTVLTPRGRARGVQRLRPNARAKVDCFYVYPTTSDQPRTQATLSVDPELRAIARYQASRFSPTCRLFAPVYRQITLQGLLHPETVTDEQRAQGYLDVRDAWRRYLARDNRGRGVVLIGHSQGTRVLRQLVREEVDPKPAVRRRLVSALLLGGNVLVKRGRDVGGDFQHVRACRSSTQLGCVVAYSTFNATPPTPSRFGRPADPAQRATLQVLCTNPAALGGGAGVLSPAYATTPFPGLIGTLIPLLGAKTPKVSTPWVSVPGAYRARCSSAADADVLQITSLRGAPVLSPVPDATWGLHLADVNIAFGNLEGIVQRQVARYLARGRAGGARFVG